MQGEGRVLKTWAGCTGRWAEFTILWAWLAGLGRSLPDPGPKDISELTGLWEELNKPMGGGTGLGAGFRCLWRAKRPRGLWAELTASGLSLQELNKEFNTSRSWMP